MREYTHMCNPVNLHPQADMVSKVCFTAVAWPPWAQLSAKHLEPRSVVQILNNFTLNLFLQPKGRGAGTSGGDEQSEQATPRTTEWRTGNGSRSTAVRSERRVATGQVVRATIGRLVSRSEDAFPTYVYSRLS